MWLLWPELVQKWDTEEARTRLEAETLRGRVGPVCPRLSSSGVRVVLGWAPGSKSGPGVMNPVSGGCFLVQVVFCSEAQQGDSFWFSSTRWNKHGVASHYL